MQANFEGAHYPLRGTGGLAPAPLLQWLGPLSFLDDTEFDPERIRLTWDDVVRHGPGLIADYRHAGGGQFLSWAE